MSVGWNSLIRKKWLRKPSSLKIKGRFIVSNSISKVAFGEEANSSYSKGMAEHCWHGKHLDAATLGGQFAVPDDARVKEARGWRGSRDFVQIPLRRIAPCFSRRVHIFRAASKVASLFWLSADPCIENASFLWSTCSWDRLKRAANSRHLGTNWARSQEIWQNLAQVSEMHYCV